MRSDRCRSRAKQRGTLILLRYVLLAIAIQSQSHHQTALFASAYISSLSSHSSSHSSSSSVRSTGTTRRNGIFPKHNHEHKRQSAGLSMSSTQDVGVGESVAPKANAQTRKDDPNRFTNNSSNKDSSASASCRAELSPAETGRQIVQLGRAGKTDQALKLYQSMERPAVRQLNAAIDATARARPRPRLQQAFALLEETLLQPNVYTFGALMSACGRAGDVNAATLLLSTMQTDYGVAPNAVVYNAAVSACSHAVKPDAATAWKLLDQAATAGVALTVVGYNAALSAAARAGEYEAALQLLDTMLSDPTKPQPDAVTYGTILAACEKSRQWNLVLDYAGRMQQAGFALDGLAATSALKACQQLGLAAAAVDYLEQMKASAATPYRRKTAGWQMAGHRRALQGPDAVAYTLAISACARGGAWQQGMQLLDEYMTRSNSTGTTATKGRGADSDHSVMMYTAAMNGCEYAGEWGAAFRLLERMRKQGVEPNEGTYAAVIGACATACAKQHHYNRNNDNEHKEVLKRGMNGNTMPLPLKKALQLLSVLKKDETIADPCIQIYNAAIRACAEAMDLPRAFQLLDTARQEGLEPTVITYGSLMTACERIGSVDDLTSVFKLLKQDGLEPNEIIYGAAISCCRKAGEAERALLLFHKMVREELRPNVAVFNTVIMAQAESKARSAKDMDRAILVYKILKSQQYSSACPNRQTYSILIRTLTVNKRPRDAEGLLRQMNHDGLTPDVDLYTATVSAYEQIGQPMQALRLMESMRDSGYDFYEAPVLNAAFKRAVRLVNVVGRGLSSSSAEDDVEAPYFIDVEDGQGEAFVSGE